MANQENPLSLRPGESAVSPLLQPARPHQPSEDQSFGGLLPTNSSMPPKHGGQSANYSGRFPSGHYSSDGGQVESSSAAQQSTFHNDFSSREHQNRVPQTSFVGPVPPMPVSPPHDYAQPLFAQHSGMTGPGHHAGTHATQPRTPPANIQNIPVGNLLSQPQSTTNTRPSSSQVTNNSTRSPFTTPITSPPRNRPNQVLVINPTSTTSLTASLLNTLRPILPPALELTAYTATYPCPTAIESTTDAILSSESCLRDLAKHSTNNGETVQNFDALLVCSYGKHPLIDALRESYDVPVTGIMEASLYVARMLGARFGIVTPTTRAKVGIDDAVAAYGLSQFFVGVESLHVSALELVDTALAPSSTTAPQPQIASSQAVTPRTKEDLNKRITHASRALVVRGADTIILGSEFLSSNEHIRAVKDAVRDEDGRRTVNVIDSVEAGVMMLNALVGMGVPTSKRGVYRNEREGRRVRGQVWL